MMIPRFGEPFQHGRRYRLRPGAYTFLPLNGHVLLTFQQEPEAEFQLPGGGIDPGESTLTALHREVIEETGWRIASPRRLGAFRRFVYMPEYDKWAEKICTIYTARPVRQLSEPTEPGHTAVWAPASEVAGMLGNPGDRAFARKYL